MNIHNLNLIGYQFDPIRFDKSIKFLTELLSI